MQKLIDSEVARIELVAGQSLHVEGAGVVTSNDSGMPELAVNVGGWPVTVGPLNYSRFITIQATGALEYEVRQDQSIFVRLIQAPHDDLPDNGDPGVIYETEQGWYRFEVIDGTYKNIADADQVPLAPVNDTAPVISGEPEVDAVLEVSSIGVWDYRPTSYTYQWLIDAVEVEGATGSSFVVPMEAEGLDITCVVEGANAVGSDTETSNAISIPS